MYVYWEVSDDSIKDFENTKNDYANSAPVLRITNKTMHYTYDIPIDPFANNYYIETKDADCEYQVELGRVSNNQFINIYFSHTFKDNKNQWHIWGKRNTMFFALQKL